MINKREVRRAKPKFASFDTWLLNYDSEGARWTLGYIIKFTLLEKWYRIFGPSSKADEYAKVLIGWRSAFNVHVNRYSRICKDAKRRGAAIRMYCILQAILSHPDKPADWGEEEQDKLRKALIVLEKIIAPEPLPGPEQWPKIRVTSEGKFAFDE